MREDDSEVQGLVGHLLRQLVVIVEHGDSRWQWLDQTLRETPGVAIAAKVKEPDEAVNAAARLRPDLVVVNAELLPRDADLLARLREQSPMSKVILMGDGQDVEAVVGSAGTSGIWGYEAWEELDASWLRIGVMNAAAGLKFGTATAADRVSAALERRRRPREGAPTISDRERRVLQALIAGIKQREIARREGVSVRTIEDTLVRVEGKFNVGSLAELIARATEQGYGPA